MRKNVRTRRLRLRTCAITSASTIQAYIKLNYDPNKAMTDIMAKVQQVKYRIPKEANDPIITKTTGDTTDLMYIGFSSKVLAPNQLTDYLVRVVQPRLQAVEGVQTAEILGQKLFELRDWLDPRTRSQLVAMYLAR